MIIALAAAFAVGMILGRSAETPNWRSAARAWRKQARTWEATAEAWKLGFEMQVHRAEKAEAQAAGLAADLDRIVMGEEA